MTPEDRRIRATEAKQLLENPMFTQAFDAVNAYLTSSALSCDADDAKKAQRIVISQQLLSGIKREITRIVQDGVIAEVQISELEQRKKLAFFRR